MPIYDETPILSRDRHGLSDLHHGVAIAFAVRLKSVGTVLEQTFGRAATQAAMSALLIERHPPGPYRDARQAMFDRDGWQGLLDQETCPPDDMLDVTSFWRTAAEYAGQGIAPDEPTDGVASLQEREISIRQFVAEVRAVRSDAMTLPGAGYDYILEGCLARAALDFGGSLTLQGVQILSGLPLSAVRTAVSLGELHPDADGRIIADEAHAWLVRRREFCPSRWKNPADNQWPFDAEKAVEANAKGMIWVPQAGEGDAFTPDLVVRSARSGPGLSITIGAKGEEVQYRDFYEALQQLARTDVPRWRRRNEAGNWGIVRARGAWVAVSKDEIDRQLGAKRAEAR